MPIHIRWRSEGRTEEARGGANGKEAWSYPAAWRMHIGGVDDEATAKELSEACSTYTAQASTVGSVTCVPAGINARGWTTQGATGGLSLQGWRRITSDELWPRLRSHEPRVLFKNLQLGHFGIPFWVCRCADPKPNPFLTERHVGATP
jgi:hypothetical protein